MLALAFRASLLSAANKALSSQPAAVESIEAVGADVLAGMKNG